MSSIPISDIRSGSVVDQVFLVPKSEIRTTKTGSLYITAQLADKSGMIAARLWNAANAQAETFAKNEILRIKGRVETYQKNLQLIIESFAAVEASTVDMQNLLPSTEKDVDGLMDELKKRLLATEDKNLAQLYNLFFDDDDFCQMLRSAPAAVKNHHAHLGGLLEHIVSLLGLAASVLPHYSVIDKDLLFAGIFFHDIGKTKELSYTKGFKYTDEGQLVGHLITGINMVNAKAALIADFPGNLLNMLTHLILSHHGAYEWGSPKLPMTAEAIALHYLDNFDAKIYAFDRAVKDDKNIDSNWTEYNRMFDRRLFKGSGVQGFLADV